MTVHAAIVNEVVVDKLPFPEVTKVALTDGNTAPYLITGLNKPV